MNADTDYLEVARERMRNGKYDEATASAAIAIGEALWELVWGISGLLWDKSCEGEVETNPEPDAITGT